MRFFILGTILVFCCLATGCKGLVYKVPTDSMKPTINIGDICYANPFAYSNKKIERFDLVVFQSTEMATIHNLPKDTRYIKRVVGLPNEKIEIRKNKIYINDILLDESSFEKVIDESDYKRDFPPIIIPNDEYFLIGDNRPGSEDSRYWKKSTVQKEDILGKIIEIVHN